MDAFSGRPVWLASVSHRDHRGDLIATGDWTSRDQERGARILQNALAGAGNPCLEREFRMNVTRCLHRACSAVEVARLPDDWETAPGGLAGGPVELIRTTGMEVLPAAMPCEDPGQSLLDPRRPDLWVPVDCGRCLPCRARAAIRGA